MFEKLRVVELASVLAGPSVGQFFAELGAEVIKIENPKTGGDVTRSWLFKGEQPVNGVSSYFSSVNWGKKSVLLDLSVAKGTEQLHALIKTADLVIASYKPGDAEKLQVDYKTLSALNPRLIYGHITGYGPNDGRVGYDAVIQAESGFMSINGEKGGDPLKMPVALMDVLAAHHLKEGLLISLIQRMTTGKGSYVPVSLIDAAVSSLANQAANFLVGGMVPARKGNEHPNIAPYGDVFKTKDGRQLILAVGNDKQFQSLCKILGLEVQQEFLTNSGRVQNRDELRSLLEQRIGPMPLELLMSQLASARVPAGEVKTMDQVMKEGDEAWFLEEKGIRGIRNFMAVPSFSKAGQLIGPPVLGEHTRVVLNQLE